MFSIICVIIMGLIFFIDSLLKRFPLIRLAYYYRII